MIGIFQLFMLGILLLVGSQIGLGLYYHLGLAAAGLFALYQQKLTWDRDREGCFKAFLNNNWFGASIFMGLVLEYIL